MERGELIEAGVGQGRHGFILPIPRHLMDGHAHAIAVRIAGTTSLLVPTAAEQILSEPAPSPPPAADLPAPNLHRSVAVSVIMPTFNRGQVMEMTAGRLLRAVDRLDAELVIIDDGSRDDTPERLKRLANGTSKLVTDRVPNGGPARARNLAATMSRGDDVARRHPGICRRRHRTRR
jgi:cellulose synthase/poly-beta-1,6-N-acetylglucosamine synthase-like glycosyltransferase